MNAASPVRLALSTKLAYSVGYVDVLAPALNRGRPGSAVMPPGFDTASAWGR